ncbi:MAG: hypothetical protein Q8R91_06105 [Candidatus Omnitrophota bacterium]|nr:hypothetical protein [Candidatus Omnitrophota bacterium]
MQTGMFTETAVKTTGSAMPVMESFATSADQGVSEEFLRQGYIIRDVDRPDVLEALRHRVVEMACEYLGVDLPQDDGEFLNSIHANLAIQKVNAFRVALYNLLNGQSWFRPSYFWLGKSALETLVGNELAMQSRVNLSIQMPNDESSVLDVHSDTFDAETPFQVVEWLPLVDVYDTKSMFILPPPANQAAFLNVKPLLEQGGPARVFHEVKDQLVWLRVPYGKVLIFTPNLLHGNIVNRVPETRWSFNARFKGLFTPYGGPAKSLGGYYLPITTKAVSRVGMAYRAPEGFNA